MSQAQQTDFAAYAQLSQPEQEALEKALTSIPDDILSTGEQRAIDSRIRRYLEQEGVFDTGASGGPLGVAEIPAVAFAGRAAGCLANYVTLRGIGHNKSAGTVAESIARAVAESVSGSTEAIKADILTHRVQVAGALSAIGLPTLGDALVAGDPDDSYDPGQ